MIYFPGIKLPKSIRAQPDIRKAVANATMIVFAIPHDYISPIVPRMEGAWAEGAIGISLIKGMAFEEGKPILISDKIREAIREAPGEPGEATSHARPCHTMPCHATPHPATPRHATSCHVTPRHATSRHATPCNAMPRHAMPCHAMPCHTMPSRAMPSHGMPCEAT